MISSLGSKRLTGHLCRSRGILQSSFSSQTCSTSTLVTTEHLQEDNRIAVVKLHNGPANALSLEFCRAISETIQRLENDGTTQAMILSSGLPNKIFSAGLDISKELYEPDPDRLVDFWTSFQQVFLDLYGTKNLTTIAALEGPAPAGGCMLAVSCDYRISSGSPKAVIGLNESKLGIVAPPWMCRQYIDVLGHRQAELALMEGTLFSPQQALQLGLVDEIENKNVQAAAVAKAKAWKHIPQPAKAAVKELTRTPLLESLQNDRDQDVDFFRNFVTAPHVQTAIGRYLQAMEASKSQKKSKV